MNSKVFRQIIAVSTALGFAATLGSVACLEQISGQGFAFRWHSLASIWMILGAAGAWQFWRVVWNAEDHPGKRSAAHLKRYCAVLAASGIGLFAYPIHFAASEHFGEVLSGLLLAAAVLSFVGWVLWRVIQGFAANDALAARIEADHAKI